MGMGQYIRKALASIYYITAESKTEIRKANQHASHVTYANLSPYSHSRCPGTVRPSVLPPSFICTVPSLGCLLCLAFPRVGSFVHERNVAQWHERYAVSAKLGFGAGFDKWNFRKILGTKFESNTENKRNYTSSVRSWEVGGIPT